MVFIPTEADKAEMRKEFGMPDKPPTVGFIPTENDKRMMRNQLQADKINRDAPSPHGFLYNLMAGTINPFINAANLVPEGIDKVESMVTGKDMSGNTPRIPVFRNVGGIGYDIGNLASFAVPFAGEARLADMALQGAKSIPEVGKAIESLSAIRGVPTVANLAHSGASGAALGALMAPETQREAGAIGGGIGAPLGELALKGASALGGSTLRKSKEIVGAAVKPLEDFFAESTDRFQDSKPEESLENAYNNIKNSIDWDNVNNLAKNVDNTNPLPFNDDDYLNAVKNEIAKLSEANERTGNYGELLNKVKPFNRSIKNFQDAVRTKKELNQIAEWGQPQGISEIERLSRQATHNLGQALDQSVLKSSQGVLPEGLSSSSITPSAVSLLNENKANANNFVNEWNRQRQLYARLQDFYKDPFSGAHSRFMRQAIQNNEFGKYLKKYALQPEEGVNIDQTPAKMTRLTGLLQNPETVKNAFMKYALPINKRTGEVDMTKLAENINQKKVSPLIMSYLNNDEKSALKQIINAKTIQRQLAKDPTFLERMSKHPVMTALGSGALGKILHLPLHVIGMLTSTGLFAPRMIQKGISEKALREAENIIDRRDFGRLEALSKIGSEKARAPRATTDKVLDSLLPASTGALGQIQTTS